MLHSQGDSAIEVADLIVAPSQRGQGLGGLYQPSFPDPLSWLARATRLIGPQRPADPAIGDPLAVSGISALGPLFWPQTRPGFLDLRGRQRP
jgi:hypothetical protein